MKAVLRVPSFDSVALGCTLWPTLTASLSIATPASSLKGPWGSAKVLFFAFFANCCFQPAAIKASSTDLHTLVLLTATGFFKGTSFLTLVYRALLKFPIAVSIEGLEQVLLGRSKRVIVGNLVLKSTSPWRWSTVTQAKGHVSWLPLSQGDFLPSQATPSPSEVGIIVDFLLDSRAFLLEFEGHPSLFFPLQPRELLMHIKTSAHPLWYTRVVEVAMQISIHSCFPWPLAAVKTDLQLSKWRACLLESGSFFSKFGTFCIYYLCAQKVSLVL